MTESSTPPARHSLRPSPEKVWATVKFTATVLATIGGTLITLYNWVESHVTETELADRTAPLLERIEVEETARRAQGVEIERLRHELEKQRGELFYTFWLRVGDKASENEPDWRKRQRAAERARDRFEGYYRSGLSLEEAYRRAVDRGLP